MPFPADTSDAGSIAGLVAFAQSQGDIKTAINAAAVSPHMDDPERIFTINACGTVIVDQAFAPVMAQGGVILNVSSMAAYMLPADRVPVQLYKAAFAGPEALAGGFKQMMGMLPADQATGVAYSISKNFVIWYTERMAVELGKKGVRVVSISPGTFSTPIGKIEGKRPRALPSAALSGALAIP